MKRELAFTGLGLLLGAGLGVAVGLRVAHRPGPIPPVVTELRPSDATLPAHRVPAKPTDSPEDPTATEKPLTLPEARQRLDQWLAAGASADQLPQVYEWLETWAKADPIAAVKFVNDAPRFPQRNTALAVPLSLLAQTNPSGALAWLLANLDGTEQRNVAEGIIGRMGHDFPREALQIGFNQHFSVEPYWASELIGKLATTNPQEALGYFARLNHAGREQSAGPFVSGWYEQDRAAALQWCDSQRDTAHFTTAATALIQKVSESQPVDFDQLVKQLKLTPAQLTEIGQHLDWNSTDQALVFLPYLGPADTARVMSSVLDEQLPIDPAGAIKFARDVMPAATMPETVAQAWTSWLNSDRKAALAWAETISDPALKAKIDDTLRSQTAEMEPQRFLADLEKAGTGSPASTEQIAAAVNALAHQDSAAAVKWINDHPQLAPIGAVAEVAAEFMRQDPAAAFAWIQKLPAGPNQDRAVRSAIEHWVGNKDFDLATQAVATISDPQRQLAMRLRIFAGISEKSTAEAQSWLETQPIHPEARASWIALMQEFQEGEHPGG